MRLARLFVVAAVLAALTFTAPAAYATTVTPSERVEDFVTVRSAPRASAAAIDQLEVGHEATLLASVPGWHKVRLENGRVGYVPKGWTTDVITPADETADAAIAPDSPTRDAAAARGDLYAGLPRATHADAHYDLLTNRAYSVGFSESRKDPVWVAYRLAAKPNAKRPKKRPGWRADDRTNAPPVDSDCYKGAKVNGRMIDRGHNAPNFAIATRFGKEAQRETFLMSNVCPQYACLNEQPWQGFEKAEVGYANQFGTVWTVTGPIFDASPKQLSCGAEVPTAFYKIVVDAQPGAPPAMLAVVMRQTDRGAARRLTEFVTTVDDVEARTGLDFFSELDDATENAAEAAHPDSRWQLNRTLVPDHPCRDKGA